MSNLYQKNEKQPFHISVGAVLVNSEGKICVHTAPRTDMPENVQKMLPQDVQEVCILMRESLENGETLEAAVLRGIQEEFGAEGVVRKYLGSTQGVAYDPTGDIPFEKTTLYFEVELMRLGERPADDAESYTSLVWMEPETLIQNMKRQQHPARGDLDESKILEAYVKYR